MPSPLILLTAALAVSQAGPPPTAEEMSPAEAARLESRRLTNIRQVTFGFARAGEGYFSPDGESILFQAVPNRPPSIFHTARPDEDGYQMYIADLADDAVPLLASTGRGRCTCGFFRPDGKKILFASTHLEAGDGAAAAQAGPAYSRSQRYRWDFAEAMDIFEANPDGTELVRLTAAPGYDAEGSYSPDGSQIVFTSFRDADGDGEIYIMGADGSNPRRITHAGGYDGGPFFSPDGKRIVYRSDRRGDDRLQLFVNNAEGTAERQLTDNAFVNWGPYWHPDGRHIAYATSRHGHQNYEIYLMDVDAGAEERLTYAAGFDALPVFSPDGRRMMWTSKGRTNDQTSQLFIADFSLAPRAQTDAAP